MTDSIVKTHLGDLRGRQVDRLYEFLGIAYATPPVGERRWLPPVPMEPWSGTRDALTVGTASYQDKIELLPPSPTSPNLGIEEPQGEDCLFLNLWTSDLSGLRPVMVWIHGGGFAIGSGSQPMYHGSGLCQRDVVVVSINYRLGVFGFMHLDGPTNGAIPASGNEGLLDQAMALQWVRDNIAAFGGDPNNVTIFGESGGAQSVSALLCMPAAEGLFHKAIIQSSPGHGGASLKDAIEFITPPLLNGLGGDPVDASALLNATPEEVMEAAPGMFARMAKGHQDFLRIWQRPVIDGTVLPCTTEQALTQGRCKGIPLMSGTTRDETMVVAPEMTEEMVLDAVHNPEIDGLGMPMLSQEQCTALIETYRTARAARNARTDPAALLSVINTHKSMWVPTTRLLDAQRPHAAVYSYIFDWATPVGEGALGAPHGIDVGFVFGTHKVNPAFSGSGPAADALANAVMNAWAAFAHAGDPSSDGLGEWPTYDAENRATMMIGQNVHIERAPYEAERCAWEGIPTEDLHRV
jgi:para-nitrobenzyl esterase